MRVDDNPEIVINSDGVKIIKGTLQPVKAENRRIRVFFKEAQPFAYSLL